MSNHRPISEYSRQELYDLIWSTPASKLAAEFEISDVAVAKRCKKLNIPRPSRGYWAKIAAGQTPRKIPLPPPAGDLFKQIAQRRIAKKLPLPGNTEPLLPLASEMANAIAKAKLDNYKRAHFKEPSLPEICVSKVLAERMAQAFHVLLRELEPLGIRFRKFQGFYESGYFERHRDRLSVTIIEDVVGLDGSRVVAPYWRTPQGHEKPSGYLTFLFNPERYNNREDTQWSEGAKLPLEKLLAQMVAYIRKHYLEKHERRELEKIESARRHAEWLKSMEEMERKEAIQRQREKERKHAEAIAAAAQARKAALLDAADKWRLSRTLLEFIDACEARWQTQPDGPMADQSGWVKWAKDIATAMSPFSVGYPDPAIDGPFDPSLIPPGGPYPAIRKFK